MTIDISDLLKKKSGEKKIDLIIEASDFKSDEFIKFNKPVHLSGILNLLGDIINFDGIIRTELELVCSRCNENFNQNIDIPIVEKFSNKEKDINVFDDIIYFNGDNIDITDVIQNNIIMTLPIKMLCMEDCKGLCQNCGTNLNFHSCNCSKDTIDPRLSKLKDLFSAN
ncbi:MAG: DUF177 domain-containing protein [Bacillota bacterium]|nr:DUF177 domain-containing protein [Bacillota bacterium]